MSSSSRMCDATPFANAAAAADPRPAPNIVDSLDVPRPAATCCAMRAGGSIDPASADPSQSRIDRFAWSTTSCGRSVYVVADSTSASARLTSVRGCGGPLDRVSDTYVLQPLHNDRQVDN